MTFLKGLIEGIQDFLKGPIDPHDRSPLSALQRIYQATHEPEEIPFNEDDEIKGTVKRKTEE